MLAASGGGSAGTGWIIFGTVLTAVFTLGILVVSVIAHLHDRAQSGTRRPVIAKRVRSSWRYDGRQTPVPQTETSNAKIVAIRLINRAEFRETISVDTSATRFWFRRTPTIHASPIVVGRQKPETFLIGFSGGDLPSRSSQWMTLIFETGNHDRFKFRGRLRLWSLSGQDD